VSARHSHFMDHDNLKAQPFDLIVELSRLVFPSSA
jgi:hypothetical protein